MHIQPSNAAWFLMRWASSIGASALFLLIVLSAEGLRAALNGNPTSYGLSNGLLLVTTAETLDGGPVTFLFATQVFPSRLTLEWEPTFAAWPPLNAWTPQLNRGYIPGIRLDNSSGFIRTVTIPLLPIAVLAPAVASLLWCMRIRHRSRIRPNHCPCGYDLSGLAATPSRTPPCLECGRGSSIEIPAQ